MPFHEIKVLREDFERLREEVHHLRGLIVVTREWPPPAPVPQPAPAPPPAPIVVVAPAPGWAVLRPLVHSVEAAMTRLPVHAELRTRMRALLVALEEMKGDNE